LPGKYSLTSWLVSTSRLTGTFHTAFYMLTYHSPSPPALPRSTAFHSSLGILQLSWDRLDVAPDNKLRLVGREFMGTSTPLRASDCQNWTRRISLRPRSEDAQLRPLIRTCETPNLTSVSIDMSVIVLTAGHVPDCHHFLSVETSLINKLR